ncbi:phage tail tape measure protein [Ruminococcus champanellensis]
MANRIKGITVEIGGDTTKLSKALEGVNKNIKNTQTQLKDVEKLLKLDPSNTELLSQKHKLLADAVTATKEKLETLKTAAEQANTALANGDISQEQYDALQREIIETEQELQNLQREAEASSTALAKLGQAGEMLEKAGDKIADVGTTLTAHVTVPIAAAGTAAVKTAADFDSAMSKVAAVSGATGDELDALRDKAREMGAKTKFSASEAADAMNYMAMAGWKTGDMLEGIEGIMNLAAASGEDLATTSDIVTDALTAFGLSAADSGHFADVLAAASSNANTNVSMMGETFKYCAPVAGSLGFSCEDTAQAIGLMANSGIKSTQAGTSLRSIMTALAGEVKFCGDAFGEMEIATTNQDGSMRELNDILADCRVAFAQMSESEQASAAQALVGKNAMSGFLALMNAAPGDIDKLQNAIATCSDEVDGYNGVTEKMAAVMQDNLGGQLTILKSQLQELAISFGEILMPAIRSIVSRIQGLIDKFNALSPATKETIVKIALVAAALGPLLVVVGKTMVGVGKLMKFVSNLPTIIAGAKAAFTSFGAVIGGISAPVVAVIAVVAALVAAFVHLWRTNEDFRNKITAIWEQIKSIFSGFCQGIVDRINALGFDFKNITEVIKAVWDGLCKFLKPVFEGQFQQIANTFKAVTDIILSILDIFVGIFTGDWSRVWDGIKGIFAAVWNFIKDTLKNALNMICGIFGTDLGEVKEFWVNVWTSIKNFFVNIWNGIKNFVSTVLNAIKNFFTTIWTGIKNFFVGIWTAIYNSVSEKINLIKTVITVVWNAIHTAISTVMDAIHNVISTVWNAISGFISGVVNTIWSVISSIWNSIKDHITNTLNAIHAVVSAVWNAISGFISGVLNTISSVVSSIWNGIKNTVTNILNAIKTTVSNIWDSVKNAVTQKITAIKDTIVNGFNAAVNFIKNLASQAFQWGADIINGIVNGIKNCMGKVADAVKGVANKIKSFLHFSVPDEGPLADFESWMPDFMQGLADGINANANVVGDAVNGFAGGLAEKISSVIQSALSNVVTSVQGFMTQVFDTVKTVWTNANAAIDATMTQISSGITSGWKTIVSTIKTALENIRNVITTTWKAVSSVISAALDSIKKIVTAVWAALKNLIKTGQLDIKSVVTTTWEAVSGVVRTAVNAIKSVVQSVWNAMPDTVRSAMNRVKEAVLSIWDGIKNGIGDRLGGVRDAVVSAMNAVYNAVMDKVNSSWSWGRDLMQNLINGITYMLGSLINTVSDVARSIWEYLHFSVPEKGALTDVEEWMPDFMKGLAKGINKSKKYVEAAVSGVADAMTLTMQSGLNVDMDGISGAMMNGTPAGTVINNYNNDNSRTVNQTNHSPKSLSRLEIYRQTQNALNV